MFDTTGLTLRDIADVFRRRWWVVALVTAAVTLVTIVPTLTEDATYASEATVRNSYSTRDLSDLTDTGDDRYEADAPDEGLTDDERDEIDERAEAEAEATAAEVNAAVLELVADLELVQSTRFRREVADRLREDGNPADFGRVSATLVPFSTVFEIRVTAADPGRAAEAAQVAAEVFVERRIDAAAGPFRDASEDRSTVAETLDDEIGEIDARLLDPATPTGEREALLAERSADATAAAMARRDAAELELEADLRVGSIGILSDATASRDAIDTSLQRPLAIGLVLGLLLGAAVALVSPRSRR